MEYRLPATAQQLKTGNYQENYFNQIVFTLLSKSVIFVV